MKKTSTQETTATRADENLHAGCDMASLQASPEGLPVYERMGFQHVGYYRTYIPQEA